jgi:hypothetical protein
MQKISSASVKRGIPRSGAEVSDLWVLSDEGFVDIGCTPVFRIYMGLRSADRACILPIFNIEKE